MAYLVRMPKLGLEMKEGTVLMWHVAEGDAVEAGDVLCEIESEKTTAEVEAREDGVLRRIALAEGETAEPGHPIGIVAGGDEDVADLKAELNAAAAGDTAEPETAAGTPTVPVDTAGGAEMSGGSGGQSGGTKATPRARRRAAELGVSLAGIDGSGPQGAITESDVEAAAEAGGGPDEAPMEPGLTLREERPLSGMRRTIADRLSESYRNAVHVTEHRTIDAEALFTAADTSDAALDTAVTMPDVLLVALSASLDDHPAFNATFEDGVHRLYKEHNVAIAVDIEVGLITPVLRDTGAKSLATVAAERRSLTERAHAGEYTMGDLHGGTFTVTNLGTLGVEYFDPVINPPQVAILGVNTVASRPVEADGGVAFRRHLPLSLSFDHRVVDGADAARFLGTLAGHLEDPWPLLPDMVKRPVVASGGHGAGSAAKPVTMPDRRVTTSSPAGYAGTASLGSFEWSFDEPESVGGTGTAPTPIDHFLGSFAACLSASLRYQVGKHDLDVGGIDVTAEARPDRGPVDAIDISISLSTAVDDATIERLIDLAERGCHVSSMLRDDLPVSIGWERP